jgi:CheY-like chemotaxis protein
VSANPTVYFIDDSATMREVIKIAFRRENINVVAYNDANSALGEIENSRPDVVISDVIMPDKDGYEVCQFIKQNANLSNIPVILMSGVVNKAVAERAFSVKADELIRKPFQPQDLITRVRHLLKPGAAVPVTPAAAHSAAAALSSIFQQPVPTAVQRPPMPQAALPLQSAAQLFAAASTAAAPRAAAPAPPPVAAPAPAAHPPMPQRPVSAAPAPGGMDLAKMKLEILRLEGLVKKLQSELSAEREYSKALEDHVKTLQESD